MIDLIRPFATYRERREHKLQFAADVAHAAPFRHGAALLVLCAGVAALAGAGLGVLQQRSLLQAVATDDSALMALATSADADAWRRIAEVAPPAPLEARKYAVAAQPQRRRAIVRRLLPRRQIAPIADLDRPALAMATTEPAPISVAAKADDVRVPIMPASRTVSHPGPIAALNVVEAPVAMAMAKAPVIALPKVMAAKPRLPSLKPSGAIIVLARPTPANSKLAALNFDISNVRRGADTVPRVYLAKLPSGLTSTDKTGQRKALFIKTVLPLVLRANEEIRAQRYRLLAIATRLAQGDTLAGDDKAFMSDLFEAYDLLDSNNIGELLRRVDTLPASLALAQAAEESGWGTSRFARQGNAVFGQRTFGGAQGIVPLRRPDGRRFKVRAFSGLYDSVRSYMRNLNTHNAYVPLRRLRAELRARGRALRGLELATALKRYSERGGHYIDTIRTIIRVNKLQDFDSARLSPETAQGEATPKATAKRSSS